MGIEKGRWVSGSMSGNALFRGRVGGCASPVEGDFGRDFWVGEEFFEIVEIEVELVFIDAQVGGEQGQALFGEEEFRFSGSVGPLAERFFEFGERRAGFAERLELLEVRGGVLGPVFLSGVGRGGVEVVLAHFAEIARAGIEMVENFSVCGEPVTE